MMERLFRSHGQRLQVLYERVPPSMQSVLTSARGWFLTRVRYAPAMYELLRTLRSHEAWTAEQIAKYQLRRLQEILDHARNTVPFYSTYPNKQLRSLADFSQLPVLTREMVRENAHRMLSRAVPNRERIVVGTTGTTGANLRVAYSRLVAQRNWAFWTRQWIWAGVKHRQARVTFFASRVVPAHRNAPPYWTFNYFERQVLMSIFHLSERTATAYLDFLSQQQGKVLEGFPSVLGILADFVLARGEQIPMYVVFTSGEPLYPFVREKLEKAFSTRVYDSYGMTEFCGLIQECEQRSMHLIPDYGYLEILDENHQPVASGKEGFLVWTGFVNDTMPLIRYRIGDRGLWQDGGSCGCGRVFPLVVPTITRESDLLRSPDGRIFSPRALNQLLKSANSFRFCQFVQVQSDHVVVRAVASNGKADADLRQVGYQLQRLLGPTMQVTAELSTEPISRVGGKIPLIVQQVA